MTDVPFFECAEDALREAVRALGGAKKVGPMLWTTKSQEAASRLLQDCLNPSRDEKLELGQIMFIFRAARDVGAHGPFLWFAGDVGYDAKPTSRAEETDRLLDVIEHATATLTNALAQVERLNPQPMRRVG